MLLGISLPPLSGEVGGLTEVGGSEPERAAGGPSLRAARGAETLVRVQEETQHADAKCESLMKATEKTQSKGLRTKDLE